MKKIALLLLSVLVLSFAACKKEKNESKVQESEFTIKGVKYNLSIGHMEYYGVADNTNLANIDLELQAVGVDSGLYLEMYVSSENKKLVAGIYMMANRELPTEFSFTWGNAVTPSLNHRITGGSVMIDVSGSIYTIIVDCTLEPSGTITGTYKGPLGWSDET